MRKASSDEKLQILRQVGVAFQQGALFDSMSVRDNLFFAMEHMTDLGVEEMESRCKGCSRALNSDAPFTCFPTSLVGVCKEEWVLLEP